MTNNNNNGLNNLLNKISEYKGFIIKFIALMFHDNIIPKNISEDWHGIEIVIFIVLIIMLLGSFIKIMLSLILDIIESSKMLLKQCIKRSK